MARKIKIPYEMNVGLTAEMFPVLKFAAENTGIVGIAPSIWARIAIAEKLAKDGWIQKYYELANRAKGETPNAA
jgi:hypothetical protein